MAEYKDLIHTAEEIDKAIEDEKLHTADTTTHTCAEEKARWDNAANQLNNKSNKNEVYNKTEIDRQHAEMQAAIDENAAETESNKSDILSAKSDIATIDYAVGSPSKNFVIVRTSVSGEYYGAMWTKNEDESITINGTPTQNNFPIIADFTPTKIGKYILSGCPKGGGQGSYQLYIEGLGYDAGFGVTLNVTELKTYRVKIAAYANYTYDNLTFYPMIRPADITDDAYEPYKPSLQEQINALVTEIAELKSNLTTTVSE